MFKVNDFIYNLGVYWDETEKKYTYKSKVNFFIWYGIVLVMLVVAIPFLIIAGVSTLLMKIPKLIKLGASNAWKGLSIGLRVIIAPFISKRRSE